MKFKMNGKQFKSCIKRVMDIAKSAAVLDMAYIRIKAENNTVSFGVASVDCCGNVWTEAEVIEEGCACVFVNDIKRVYGMPDMLMVSTSGNAMSVQNHKKRSQVACKDLEENTYFHAVLSKPLFVTEGEALIRALLRTDRARATSDICASQRECMEGFHFNGTNRKIVATDGFRMHAVELDMRDEDNCLPLPFEKTVHGCIYGHLKKMMAGQASQVKVYDAEKFLVFRGEDFDYRVCVYECNYPKVLSIVPNDSEYSFQLSPQELLKIAKEYAVEKSEAMYFSCSESLITAMVNPDFRTSDLLESYQNAIGLSEERLLILNPVYVVHAMEAFDGNQIKVYGKYKMSNLGANNQPIVFEADDLLALILPVIPKPDKLRSEKLFVESARNSIYYTR